VSLSLLDRRDESTPADRPEDRAEGAGPVPGPTPTAAPRAGRQAELVSPGSPRVLVVDDTSSIRTEICHLLEDAGLTVVGEGGDGAEGVMLARELRPDVVVMDVRMPILDGIAATGFITRELPSTRVIVFSAFDDHELTNAARAAGASGFLPKGASPAAIADAVRDATR
jgi:DNA-binding NarL/FixJ family response regulator